jgi:magnesium transporter
MITVHRWDHVSKACAHIPADQLPATAADVGAEDVLWIDLDNPTPEEEEAVFGRFLKVHTLTLEDVTKPRREPDRDGHFPKAEEFPDYLLVIVNPLPPGLAEVAAKSPPGAPAKEAVNSATKLIRHQRPQLSAVLTRQVLVTHHYEPLSCVDTVQQYVDRHGESARRGPDYLFHLVLDAMVDEYAPVVDRIAARLDTLENHVFRKASDKILQPMLRLKRLVVWLRKTLILEREVLARLVRGEFELVEQREIAYYRNVYDHLVRYTELIEGAREMVSDLMQSHLAAVSTRLNRIMKVLTMISTVILPMSLIAGIYGMNFRKGMPELDWEYGYPFALGLMALVGVVAFVLFRWKRWI